MVWKTLRAGETLKIGEMELRHEGSVLVYRDPYGSGEVEVEGSISLWPARPIRIPEPIAKCVSISLKRQRVFSDGEVFWLSAPYEVVVSSRDSMIVRLTPFKVKFVLDGPIIGGRICRYHESPVFGGEPKGDLAAIKIIVRAKGTVLLKRISFPGDFNLFYRGDKVYYEEMEVEERTSGVVVKLTGRPPVEGAKSAEGRKTLKVAKEILMMGVE